MAEHTHEPIPDTYVAGCQACVGEYQASKPKFLPVMRCRSGILLYIDGKPEIELRCELDAYHDERHQDGHYEWPRGVAYE